MCSAGKLTVAQQPPRIDLHCCEQFLVPGRVLTWGSTSSLMAGLESLHPPSPCLCCCLGVCVTELVEQLIEAGAPVSEPEDSLGLQPLHLACIGGITAIEQVGAGRCVRFALVVAHLHDGRKVRRGVGSRRRASRCPVPCHSNAHQFANHCALYVRLQRRRLLFTSLAVLAGVVPRGLSAASEHRWPSSNCPILLVWIQLDCNCIVPALPRLQYHELMACITIADLQQYVGRRDAFSADLVALLLKHGADPAAFADIGRRVDSSDAAVAPLHILTFYAGGMCW